MRGNPVIKTKALIQKYYYLSDVTAITAVLKTVNVSVEELR